jgi:hypothetical protein
MIDCWQKWCGRGGVWSPFFAASVWTHLARFLIIIFLGFALGCALLRVVGRRCHYACVDACAGDGWGAGRYADWVQRQAQGSVEDFSRTWWGQNALGGGPLPTSDEEARAAEAAAEAARRSGDQVRG